MRNIFQNYKTSREYSHLKELLDNGKKVVVFSGYWDTLSVIFKEDDCHYKFWREDDFIHSSDTWDLTPWGDWFEKTLAKKQPTFNELCEEYNIEYLEPTNYDD